MTTFGKIWAGFCIGVGCFYLIALAGAVMRGESCSDHEDCDDE